jgi:hypothetical protein
LYAYLSTIESIFSKDADRYNSILDSGKSASSNITAKIQMIIGKVISSKGNLSYDELTTIALSCYEILITLEFSFAHFYPNDSTVNNNNDKTNLNDNEISYCELWTKLDFPSFEPPFNQKVSDENYIDVIDAGNIKKTKKVEKNHLMYTIFNHFLTNKITCSSYFVVTLEDRIRVFLPMNSKAESIAIENFLHPYILKPSM